MKTKPDMESEDLRDMREPIEEVEREFRVMKPVAPRFIIELNGVG